MFNVVFVHTREAGGYEGVIVWSSWSTEADFEKSYTEWPEEKKNKQRILEKGISSERCVELVKQTPIACYIAAAVQKAGGNKDILRMELANIEFIVADRE
jgi:hypothetical protein